MQITWHGFSCFKITEQHGGEEVTVVIDPFENEDGAKLPRNLSADIVITSHDHPRHRNLDGVSGEPFIIDGPGEFEVKDVFVTGVDTYHDMVDGKELGKNTMTYITVGNVHLVHLGDLNHPLEDKHLVDFHEIDVLFVPVGGGGALDAKRAAAIVTQLEPRMIVPMHYKSGSVGASLDSVDGFIKALALTKPDALPKLKLAHKDLPQDEMKVVLLDPQ